MTTTVLNTKIGEVDNEIPHHAKFITTQEFNKLTGENFAARLTQANLVSKTDFDNKLINFNIKVTSNKTKYSAVLKKLHSLTKAECILQVMMDLKTRLFIKQHLIHYN